MTSLNTETSERYPEFEHGRVGSRMGLQELGDLWCVTSTSPLEQVNFAGEIVKRTNNINYGLVDEGYVISVDKMNVMRSGISSRTGVQREGARWIPFGACHELVVRSRLLARLVVNRMSGPILDLHKRHRYDSRGDKPTFQSDAFDEYYNTQALLPPEEWKETVECLRTPLPTSFRVMDLGVSSEIVKEQARKFQEEISKLHPGQFQELPFVKDGYQVNLPRPVLRAPLSGLKSFHEFLVNQGQAGVLMRQETVSMLPALALKGELQQDSLVLDICSAPGSKTSQLLEMLNECPRPDPSKPPEGMVVANELVVKRAHLLIHRLRHHNSPNLVVTAHAGQAFPSCFDGATGRKIEFDAALCD
ncbi:hypothetical protein FOZ62_019262, partial [Perkinsus olseni]